MQERAGLCYTKHYDKKLSSKEEILTDIFQHIASQMEHMSKSQLKVAEYILHNQNTVPFLNVSTLANNADVSEATIVRFASFLGFSGYPQLQIQFQEAIQKHLTTFERLEISNSNYKESPSHQKVQQFFKDDILRLESTAEGFRTDTFAQVVEEVVKARKIYVVSNRSSAGLGEILHYYLDILLGNSLIVRTMHKGLPQLEKLDERDVMIAIGFPRYSSDTVEVFRFAHEHGAVTVALTDTLFSPLIPSAQHALLSTTRTDTFLDSYVAPLSIINALLVSISQENVEQIEGRLVRLEEHWKKYGAFASGSGSNED